MSSVFPCRAAPEPRSYCQSRLCRSRSGPTPHQAFWRHALHHRPLRSCARSDICVPRPALQSSRRFHKEYEQRFDSQLVSASDVWPRDQPRARPKRQLGYTRVLYSPPPIVPQSPTDDAAPHPAGADFPLVPPCFGKFWRPAQRPMGQPLAAHSPAERFFLIYFNDLRTRWPLL